MRCSTTKRRVLTVILLVAVALSGMAQSLLDDPAYKALVDQVAKLQADAQAAIDAGEYDTAVELADQAEDVAVQAENYAEQRVLGYRANGWLTIAKDRMTYAVSVDAKNRYPDEYALATQHLADAEDFFDATEYQDAIDSAKKAYTALENVKAAAIVVVEPEPVPVPQPEPKPVPVPQPEPKPAPVPQPEPEPTLPRYYIVRLIEERRDCFWRIAEYDFVYGDPWKWTLLYEANKDNMPDANNADLILPGMIIEIPSIAGEIRSGTWNPEDAVE